MPRLLRFGASKLQKMRAWLTAKRRVAVCTAAHHSGQGFPNTSKHWHHLCSQCLRRCSRVSQASSATMSKLSQFGSSESLQLCTAFIMYCPTRNSSVTHFGLQSRGLRITVLWETEPRASQLYDVTEQKDLATAPSPWPNTAGNAVDTSGWEGFSHPFPLNFLYIQLYPWNKTTPVGFLDQNIFQSDSSIPTHLIFSCPSSYVLILYFI